MVEARRSAATAHNFRDYKRILLTYIRGFAVTIRTSICSLMRRVRNGRAFCQGWRKMAQSVSAQPVSPMYERGKRYCLATDCRWLIFLSNVWPLSGGILTFNPSVTCIFHSLFSSIMGDEDLSFIIAFWTMALGPRTVNLEWRFMSNDAALAARQHAIGTIVPELGLREVDGVWFLSMPSFNYWGSDLVTAFRDLQKQVEENVDDIRAGVLVLDVRGNRGGISDWANDIISTIWGREWVDAINSRVEEVVDWRASPSNLARVESFIKRMDKDQLDATELKMVREVMAKALAGGQPFGCLATPANPTPMPTSSPFTGHAYFLTDYWGTSACLDFADMVMRLPKVTHVGLSTGADAVFIDVDFASLPSGMASLTYSNKVYRKQIRGNNQGSEPNIAGRVGR